MDKIKQKTPEHKMRHFGITVIKQQLELHYLKLILYSIKFRDFEKIAKIAKFSENKVLVVQICAT